MGVNNIRIFLDPVDPSEGDGIYYFYLTEGQLAQFEQLWPEFLRDFSLRDPLNPNNGILYAHPDSISAQEFALLQSMDLVQKQLFNLSRQPSQWGG